MHSNKAAASSRNTLVMPIWASVVDMYIIILVWNFGTQQTEILRVISYACLVLKYT